MNSCKVMKTGRDYRGVFRRDEVCDEYLCEEHYTFTEAAPRAKEMRNPRVYDGKYLNISRRCDGTMQPNFKQQRIGAGFDVVGYATAVASELYRALTGLVEK